MVDQKVYVGMHMQSNLLISGCCNSIQTTWNPAVGGSVFCIFNVSLENPAPVNKIALFEAIFRINFFQPLKTVKCLTIHWN